MRIIERVASREIYRNRWMVVREDDIRRPDGSLGIYSVVDKPAYALVVPFDGQRFRLVEQFRPSLLTACSRCTGDDFECRHRSTPA